MQLALQLITREIDNTIIGQRPSDGYINGTAMCKAAGKFFADWQRAGNVKQPYSIGMTDDAPFVFAGLWEGWKPPGSDQWLHTCTIITCEPNEFMATIHNRMPVILPNEVHDAWLSGEAGKEILMPFPADRIKAYPISTRVNSPRNNDPGIIVPIG